MAIFTVNFDDIAGCKKLMKEHGNSEFPFSGVNENGEEVLISVNPDNITVETFQRNGWLRTNVLWADDWRVEETYEKIRL